MDIVTIDIEAAYLEVDIDEEVYMTLEPALVDIATLLDPAYNRQRRSDGGVIVNLRRALYGTIQAARLWLQRLSKLLVAKGFEKNPYDGCLFTRADGSGVTHVCIHVDDLLVCTSNGISYIEDMLLSELKAINTTKDIFTYLCMTVGKHSHDVT
jgi:hypothetical protein